VLYKSPAYLLIYLLTYDGVEVPLDQLKVYTSPRYVGF